VDLGGAKVRVLEEEGCSGCRGTLKCDDGLLLVYPQQVSVQGRERSIRREFTAIGFQSQGLNLAAEGEEVGHLLLRDYSSAHKQRIIGESPSLPKLEATTLVIFSGFCNVIEGTGGKVDKLES